MTTPIRYLLSLVMVYGACLNANAQEATLPGQGPSQILLATRANTIVLSEVAYIAHPVDPGLFVGYSTSQTIVYRVIKSIKGKLTTEFVKVSIPVPSNNKHFLESAFVRIGSRHILLLNDSVSSESCTDKVRIPKTRRYETVKTFRIYETFPCFSISPKSILDGNEDEEKAITDQIPR